MPNEYENLAKVLMASPQGAKIVKSLDKLNAIVNTDSGRQLIGMLASEGGDAIKNAAAAAANGDQDQARVLLLHVIAEPGRRPAGGQDHRSDRQLIRPG